MLAQFGDVYVHAAGVEVVVVNPEFRFLQSEVALEDFVYVSAEQAQQFRLLGCEFL